MKTEASNREVFEREQQERESIKQQAWKVLETLETNPDGLRAGVSWLADKNDDEIRQMAGRLLRHADSPHPIDGFWDSHGRIIDKEKQ